MFRIFVLTVSLLSEVGFAAEAPEREPSYCALLLGLRNFTQLRTLWITSSDGTPKAEGEWHGVIIPHADSFCALYMKAIRVKDYTHTGIGLQCGTEALPAPSPRDPDGCTGKHDVLLLYAGREYLSFVEHESSECHGRVNYYSELSVTALNALANEWTFLLPSLEFTDVFGTQAFPLFEAAARDQCPAERAEIGSCDDVGPETDNWSIRREPGRWVVQGRVTAFASYAEKMDWHARTFDYVVPIEFQASDQLSSVRDVTTAIMSQAKPSVEDIFVSPGKDAAVVVTKEDILWFSVVNESIADELG